jgi:hypothetical protein
MGNLTFYLGQGIRMLHTKEVEALPFALRPSER